MATYEFSVRNDHDDEDGIPAFALMQICGAPFSSDGRLCYPVKQPGADFAGWPRIYLANSSTIIPKGGSGSGTLAKADNPAVVLREDEDVRYGEDWGAVDGSWKLGRVYMGGWTALGPESNVGAETKTLFHSEGPNELFVAELTEDLTTQDGDGNLATAEAEILEQEPMYTVTEEEVDYDYGGNYQGIGRFVDVRAPLFPGASTIIAASRVWVRRNSRTGGYDIVTSQQFYIPPVSATKLAAAGPTDPVALVSEL